LENKNKPKSKSTTLRIALGEATALRLGQWCRQVSEICPGIRLKKQELVDWLITSSDERLGPAQIKSIRERFYDEVRLTEWALKELKAAKARNEKLSLSDLLPTTKPARVISTTKPLKPPLDAERKNAQKPTSVDDVFGGEVL